VKRKPYASDITATEQRQFADQIARDEAKARSLSVKLQ
jgi:hypothetical protein